MKKSAVLVLVLVLVVAMSVCLTACNTNFKFKELELTKDNVTEIVVECVGDGKKVTTQSSKIENILSELDNLDLQKCKEKIADNVFIDSVVGQITFKIAGKEGRFVMTFVETNIAGNKVSLLKCEATDGLKIKNMPKDIYQLQDVNYTNSLLSKIFANHF